MATPSGAERTATIVPGHEASEAGRPIPIPRPSDGRLDPSAAAAGHPKLHGRARRRDVHVRPLRVRYDSRQQLADGRRFRQHEGRTGRPVLRPRWVSPSGYAPVCSGFSAGACKSAPWLSWRARSRYRCLVKNGMPQRARSRLRLEAGHDIYGARGGSSAERRSICTSGAWSPLGSSARASFSLSRQVDQVRAWHAAWASWRSAAARTAGGLSG